MYVQPVMSRNKSVVDQRLVQQEEISSSNIDNITTGGSNQPVCNWMVPRGMYLQNIVLEPCSEKFITIRELIDQLKSDTCTRNANYFSCRNTVLATSLRRSG